jgi:hypothetical protein
MLEKENISLTNETLKRKLLNNSQIREAFGKESG